MTDKIFSNPHHLGLIVKDMDKAIELYQSLGISPFEARKPFDRVERKSLDTVSDPGPARIKAKFADIGPIKIEMIQPLSGESLANKFLETDGEGISHLGFTVDDIDSSEAELVNRGFKLLYKSRYRNGGGIAYFDIGLGNLTIEIVQWPRD